MLARTGRKCRFARLTPTPQVSGCARGASERERARARARAPLLPSGRPSDRSLPLPPAPTLPPPRVNRPPPALSCSPALAVLFCWCFFLFVEANRSCLRSNLGEKWRLLFHAGAHGDRENSPRNAPRARARAPQVSGCARSASERECSARAPLLPSGRPLGPLPPAPSRSHPPAAQASRPCSPALAVLFCWCFFVCGGK